MKKTDNKNEYYPIDIVITWVDGSDPVWLSEKHRYDGSADGDDRIIRYRDWDLLRYWFRGVEKFLPWIHKVHFVTWGHIPSWLNTEHPKLNIVRHKDFIPEKYLPTFNSMAIEWNFHRIKDLSECFIYSNDDTFFISPIEKKDFFINAKPVDSAIESVMMYRKNSIGYIVGNDLGILNDHFNKKEVYKKNFYKWMNLKYKSKVFNNLFFSNISHFTGFYNPHVPMPLLKSVFEEIWTVEADRVDATCRHKIRNDKDINQWLVRYWQFAKGEFVPGKEDAGKFLIIGIDDKRIERTIKDQSKKMICLSDDDPDIDFEREKAWLKSCFEAILPEKSTYELF